jgi:putative ABC transport system permease protein
MNILVKDPNGKINKSDAMALLEDMFSQTPGASTMMSASSSYQIWEEMLPGSNGELINDLLMEQYDVLYGKWPEAYNEVVLVVDSNNEISDLALYSLGLRTDEEIQEITKQAFSQEQIDISSLGSWSYEEICAKEFKLVIASDKYQKQSNGTYVDLSTTETGMDYLYNNTELATDLKIVGIIRASEDAVASMMSGSLAYTSALTDYVLEKSANASALREQIANPDTDIFSGLPFATDDATELTDEQKIEAIKGYFSSIDFAKKAELYTAIMSVPSAETVSTTVSQYMAMMQRPDLEQMLIAAIAQQMGVEEGNVSSYVTAMDDATLNEYAVQILSAKVAADYAAQVAAKFAALSQVELATMFDNSPWTDAEYLAFYESYMPTDVSESTTSKSVSF